MWLRQTSKALATTGENAYVLYCVPVDSVFDKYCVAEWICWTVNCVTVIFLLVYLFKSVNIKNTCKYVG
jgi:hypothetical protein